MKSFWPTVNLVLAAVFVCFAALPKATHYGWRKPFAQQVAEIGLMIVMVSVAWAILFRPQIEKRQVTIVATLALVAMVAALFGGIHYFYFDRR